MNILKLDKLSGPELQDALAQVGNNIAPCEGWLDRIAEEVVVAARPAPLHKDAVARFLRAWCLYGWNPEPPEVIE